MRYLSVLLLFLLMGQNPEVQAQAHLQITGIQGYPALPDTAYEGTPYDNMVVSITNVGNALFLDGFDVLLMTMPSRLDTLYSDSTLSTPLSPGDTLHFTVPRYFFSPNQYDSGDNIVVVWPQARTQPVQSDTLYFDVYFQLLQGIRNPVLQGFRLFPNPATNKIYFDQPGNRELEYVIFYTKSGQIFKKMTILPSELDLSSWPSSFYFVRVKYKGEKEFVLPLLRQ